MFTNCSQDFQDLLHDVGITDKMTVLPGGGVGVGVVVAVGVAVAVVVEVIESFAEQQLKKPIHLYGQVILSLGIL